MSRRPATTDVFTAIADATRRGLLDQLGRGEQTVLSLARPFAMTLSAASQHLKLLRAVGLAGDRGLRGAGGRSAAEAELHLAGRPGCPAHDGDLDVGADRGRHPVTAGAQRLPRPGRAAVEVDAVPRLGEDVQDVPPGGP